MRKRQPNTKSAATNHRTHFWTNFSHAILRIRRSLMFMSPSIASALTRALRIFSRCSWRLRRMPSPTASVRVAMPTAASNLSDASSPRCTPFTRAPRCVLAIESSLTFAPYFLSSRDSSRSWWVGGEGEGVGATASATRRKPRERAPNAEKRDAGGRARPGAGALSRRERTGLLSTAPPFFFFPRAISEDGVARVCECGRERGSARGRRCYARGSETRDRP